MQTIGEKITQLRKKAGLSQEELGNAIGVSRQAVSKWELNAIQPKAKMIQALSLFFHVSIHYFFDELPEPKENNGRPKTLGEKIYELRRKAGVSQEQLGELLGVSRQSVSNWETDCLAPKKENLQALCTYFQVEEDYFLSEGAEAPELASPFAAEGEQTALEGEIALSEAGEPLPEKVRRKSIKIWIAVIIVAMVIVLSIVVVVAIIALIQLSKMQSGDTNVSEIIFDIPSRDLLIMASVFGAAVLGVCIFLVVRFIRKNRKNKK